MQSQFYNLKPCSLELWLVSGRQDVARDSVMRELFLCRALASKNLEFAWRYRGRKRLR